MPHPLPPYYTISLSFFLFSSPFYWIPQSSSIDDSKFYLVICRIFFWLFDIPWEFNLLRWSHCFILLATTIMTRKKKKKIQTTRKCFKLTTEEPSYMNVMICNVALKRLFHSVLMIVVVVVLVRYVLPKISIRVCCIHNYHFHLLIVLFVYNS